MEIYTNHAHFVIFLSEPQPQVQEVKGFKILTISRLYSNFTFSTLNVIYRAGSVCARLFRRND